MKSILISLFLFSAAASYSQVDLNLKRIDSIVTRINYSRSTTSQDSIIQNLPDLGLFIKTYLTMTVETNQLKKYVNYVKTERLENGITMQLITCNTFYFDQNNLIKVEESAIADQQIQQFCWYFLGDKCLYHSLQSDNAASRADLLLTMSKEMIKKVIKKSN